MKIILISGFNKCPHSAQYNPAKTMYICERLGEVNKKPETILPHCSLADAFKIIQEFRLVSSGRS